MRRGRRETEVFSIAFLDVITCGFGAIILLLVLAKTGEVPVLETSVESMSGIVRNLQLQLFEIFGETKVLNRELDAKQEQRSEWEERVAVLRAELERIKQRYASVRDDSAVNSIIKGELDSALQTLTLEMRRLLAQKGRVESDLIGGIPVDSEYVIFVIDTSGSMRNYHWENMIKQLITVLDIYPNLKGLQIMNADGDYLFSQYRGRWIPDTPGRRKVIISTLRTWVNASQSIPTGGITNAIRSFYDGKKRISIYVFGDEFQRGAVADVVDIVDRINPTDADGQKKVRIHAVGFPAPPGAPQGYQISSARFATLMRELTRRNNGTFVGLNYPR